MKDLRISTDKKELDLLFIHSFLSTETTWAKNIPLELLRKAIDNSLCFGGYVENRQVAFCRVITDSATFANLVDVFVIPEYRGNGYSKALMRAVLSHSLLQGLRRFTLATSNAHGLYADYGFKSPLYPDTYMERYSPNIYTSNN